MGDQNIMVEFKQLHDLDVDIRLSEITRVFSLESNDVGVLEFAQVLDLSLFDVPHFLYSDIFSVELTEEDSPLRPTAHPLQVRNLLKRNLPGF